MDTTQEEPLYESKERFCPTQVNGFFRRIKWALLIITLGIYYILPFIRWDRGPYAPNQAVLIDFTEKKFYFFFIELWPQEIYYFTGLLVLAALALFLMNAIAGRIWCGYLCPQTVWTDLFFAIERFFEGDSKVQARRKKDGITLSLIARRTAKHFFWIIVAIATGGAWVLYFGDAPTLVSQLFHGEATKEAYIWIGIFTLTTYTLAGYAREQVCTYMCPWPRIQAALTDEHALLVSYRYDRGEPRGSLKESIKNQAQGLPAGDCIDCYQCVAVCPTGVDIRKGFQLDCIQCGLCIDACDAVMEKVNKPTGLIAYDTDININRRSQGLEPIFNVVRPRTILYAVVMAAIGLLMIYFLVTKSFIGVNAVHDRNPLFVKLTDGSIRNAYSVHLINKRLFHRTFAINIEGLPISDIEVTGAKFTEISKTILLEVEPNQTKTVRLLLTVNKDTTLKPSTDFLIRATDVVSGEMAKTKEHFISK